jgi:hypothetical protein
MAKVTFVGEKTRNVRCKYSNDEILSYIISDGQRNVLPEMLYHNSDSLYGKENVYVNVTIYSHVIKVTDKKLGFFLHNGGNKACLLFVVVEGFDYITSRQRSAKRLAVIVLILYINLTSYKEETLLTPVHEPLQVFSRWPSSTL